MNTTNNATSLYALTLIHHANNNDNNTNNNNNNNICYLSLSSSYTRNLVLRRLKSRGWICVNSARKLEASLQFCEYERVFWETVMTGQSRASSYCVRRGLTRKSAFAQVCMKWIDKNPLSILKQTIPFTVVISTWDAFDSDKAWLTKFRIFDKGLAMEECLYEAKEAMLNQVPARDGHLWVLKPSISAKGAQVSVIRSIDELRTLLFEWSDIREWVLQQYVPRLLLLSGKKFHLRVFCVCVGACRVWLYKNYIAFFATSQWNSDLVVVADSTTTSAEEEKKNATSWSHVTNAALQRQHPNFIEEESFKSCSELVDVMSQCFPEKRKEDLEFDFLDEGGKVLGGMKACLNEVFHALQKQPAVFQPLPNCFEFYGLDFLLDENLGVHLLEFNSGPDLEQAGDRLKPTIEGLLDGVFGLGVDLKDSMEDFIPVYQSEWKQAVNNTMKVFGEEDDM
jgi:tubulin--tyrosine ligase